MDEKKDPKCILLMWSGGVSSTAILLDLLTERKYRRFDIMVHHCHFGDQRGRSRAESMACKEILEYLGDKEEYRKFFFSESVHEFSFMQPPRFVRTMSESNLVSFISASICASNLNVRRVMIGGSKTDVEKQDNYSFILERWSRIFKATMTHTVNTAGIKVDRPVLDLDFPDIFEDLPEEIQDAALSCSFPTYEENGDAVDCGECKKCWQRKLLE